MNLFSELKRRHVWRVLVAYSVASIAAIEVISNLVPVFDDLPEWFPELSVVLIAAGFPVVIALAWAFDLSVVRTPPAPELAGPEHKVVPDPAAAGTAPPRHLRDMIASAFDRDSQVIFLFYENLEAGERFYGDWLGLSRVLEDGTCRIIRTGETSYVGLVRVPELDDTTPKQARMMLSLVTDRIDAWHQRLAKKGAKIILPLGRASDGSARAFLVEDPAGNAVEFFERV